MRTEESDILGRRGFCMELPQNREAIACIISRETGVQ